MSFQGRVLGDEGPSPVSLRQIHAAPAIVGGLPATSSALRTRRTARLLRGADRRTLGLARGAVCERVKHLGGPRDLLSGLRLWLAH